MTARFTLTPDSSVLVVNATVETTSARVAVRGEVGGGEVDMVCIMSENVRKQITAQGACASTPLKPYHRLSLFWLDGKCQLDDVTGGQLSTTPKAPRNSLVCHLGLTSSSGICWLGDVSTTSQDLLIASPRRWNCPTSALQLIPACQEERDTKSMLGAPKSVSTCVFWRTKVHSFQ